MCNGCSRCAAFSSRAATFSPPGSSRRKLSRAKLSRTGEAGILGILPCFFFRLVLRPLLREGLFTRLALENAAEPMDAGGGHRLEQNSLGGRLHQGARALFD